MYGIQWFEKEKTNKPGMAKLLTTYSQALLHRALVILKQA